MKEGLLIVKGPVANIQRFSIHDGPGIRTTVFLKGCNLRCLWCHNPETLHKDLEIQFFSQNCIGCGKCFEVCPENAHQIEKGQRIFKRELCKKCGKCAEICYASALVMAGKEMTVEQVMEEVIKDQPFYLNSGGGVTFSGGEPLLQKDFAKALLIDSKKYGLHTAVDTAGNVPWQVFEEILSYVDLFLYDLKVIDKQKHEEVTGIQNHIILDNLKKLAMKGANIWIRIPIIPGINDNIDEMKKMNDFIKCLEGVNKVELLPFHRLSEKKYESLGMEYKAKNYLTPSKENMAELKKVF